VSKKKKKKKTQDIKQRHKQTYPNLHSFAC